MKRLNYLTAIMFFLNSIGFGIVAAAAWLVLDGGFHSSDSRHLLAFAILFSTFSLANLMMGLMQIKLIRFVNKTLAHRPAYWNMGDWWGA